jgi:hypothetical protein
MARFWKTFKLPGCERYEIQARWEHFGDASGPGDIYITWDLPTDMPQPDENQIQALGRFMKEVAGGYDSAQEANQAWQRAVSAERHRYAKN